MQQWKRSLRPGVEFILEAMVVSVLVLSRGTYVTGGFKA
jgi:hypothetical protein